jgi:hypothetical protein
MKTAPTTDERAPSLNEFFDDTPATDTNTAETHYDFFGDSHFSTTDL